MGTHHMGLGEHTGRTAIEAAEQRDTGAMAEDELDSFDTAWNRYMGDQSLVPEPYLEPSADGNLLNQQESIAFSRFFDNLLAQPSSPRRTARRLDEELQRLSDSTQPYGLDAFPRSENETPLDAARQQIYAAPQDSSLSGHRQQRDHVANGHPNLAAPFYSDPQRFVARQPQPHYGDAASAYDGGRNPHQNSEQRALSSQDLAQNDFYAKQLAPYLTNNYGSPGPYNGALFPKSEPTHARLLNPEPQRMDEAMYSYAMNRGSPHLPAPHAAEPHLDPKFYTNLEPPVVSSPIAVTGQDAKRPRPNHQPPPGKRPRTQRGEEQTKLNHMNSEKRRRAHIRDLFDRMCSLVPAVSTPDSQPKSAVLQETHNRLLELEAQNAKLRRKLAEKNIDTSGIPAVILNHDQT